MTNVHEAKNALEQKPMMAVTAERFIILDKIKSQYKQLPQPLRFAKFMQLLLSQVSVPLKDCDVIAGRTVDRLLTEAEEKRFLQFIAHPDYPKKGALLTSGHCSYDWDMLVNEGLDGLKTRANARLKNECNPQKQIFLQGLLGVYNAISDYILRYAAAAKAQNNTELYNALIKAATKPDDFYSALQLLWIVTLINCAYISENPTLTVGRLDMILLPFYKNDIARGTLTRERACEIITDYYCKHNLIMGRGEHQVGDAANSTTFSRILNFDAPQYLLLAGTDDNGNDAVNELTELFSECIQPSFKNPVIVVRYYKNMNIKHPHLWSVLSQKALSSSSLMFYNDDNMLKTYRRLGFDDKQARRYIHFGCNWPSVGTNAAWIQGGPSSNKFGVPETYAKRQILKKMPMRTMTDHGWPQVLMEVLYRLADKKDLTIDDVYNAFFARMSDFLDEKLELFETEIMLRSLAPSAVASFTDCFLRGSIEKAECFSASSDYFFALQSFYMFGTTADSITAVDKLVIREGRLTLRQLLDAVERDFEGDPEILAMCKNADKYGSGSELSDYHVSRLARTASDLVIEKSRPYLKKCGLFMTPCIQSDTWHFKMGLDYGATPDGRRAGQPFTQNIRPANGSATNGLTAMLSSVSKLPDDGLLSGALNLDVNPNEFTDELFGALLGTYLNMGGLHAQVSATNAALLKDAQLRPEAHRDIRVRVTGYSGVFVDIPEKLQNDIIKRFEK